MITQAELVERCRADGELALASRYWTGGVRFEVGGDSLGVTFDGGSFVGEVPAMGPGVVTLRASADAFEPMTRTVPPRFANDISAALRALGIEREGDDLIWWQYVPAIQRVVELMRESTDAAPRTVLRVSTASGSRLLSDRTRAMQRLDLFVQDFRAELEGL